VRSPVLTRRMALSEPSISLDQLPPLRRGEAAAYVRAKFNIPCAASYLMRLASIGGGPSFRKAGRYPLYSREDLDAWASAKIGPKVRSTSELTAFRATSAPVSP
jgi:hypothetical protein